MTEPEFRSLFKHHTEVCPRADWPDDAPFWSVWKTRLGKLKCDLPTALEASNRLAEKPPRFPSDHLDALSDAIVGIYRERQSRSGSPDVLRERAERGDELSTGEVNEVARMSVGCPYCEGNGIAVRHGRIHPEKKTSVHCRCVLGRWIRERCRKTAPDAYRRIPCLVESPWLDAEEHGGPGSPDPEGYGPVVEPVRVPRREYAHAGPEPAF